MDVKHNWKRVSSIQESRVDGGSGGERRRKQESLRQKRVQSTQNTNLSVVHLATNLKVLMKITD